jgi:protochlorophyllide reductase
VRELHKRYHDAYGISVAAVFPGCIAKSGLFRECTPFFRRIFPIFQQFITRQYVSNEDAGRRVARVVADPACKTSGAYFRWNKAASTDAPTVERVSNEAMDEAKCDKLWSLSEKLVGLA